MNPDHHKPLIRIFLSALITYWNLCYPICIRNVCFSPGNFLLPKFCCLESFCLFRLWFGRTYHPKPWIFLMSWPGLVLFLFHIYPSDSDLVPCLASPCTSEPIDAPEPEHEAIQVSLVWESDVPRRKKKIENINRITWEWWRERVKENVHSHKSESNRLKEAKKTKKKCKTYWWHYLWCTLHNFGHNIYIT